jgi:uncharacterized protein
MRRRILMTGATGFLGRYLSAHLTAAGDEVIALLRSRQSTGSLSWDAGISTLDPGTVSGFDAVVHLSGEPIVGRWTPGKRKRIYDSRVRSTAALAAAIAASALPPRVFLCASGVGFYGARNAEIVEEATAQGAGFLADVCGQWEEAARRAAKTSRVALMRLGVVLSQRGGVLGSLLPLYRLGLGGAPGDGAQYVSWIAIGDLANAVEHLLSREDLVGPVNFVAPHPVAARELSNWIGKVIGRPAFLRQPAWLIRGVLGRQSADETLLGSLRVEPKRLLETGFSYRCAALPEKLSELDDASGPARDG